MPSLCSPAVPAIAYLMKQQTFAYPLRLSALIGFLHLMLVMDSLHCSYFLKIVRHILLLAAPSPTHPFHLRKFIQIPYPLELFGVFPLATG